MLITFFRDLIGNRAVVNLHYVFISFVCELHSFPGGKADGTSS